MKCFLIFILTLPFLTTAIENKQKLDPQLKSSYLKLLEQAGDFHKVINQKNKKSLQREITETQEIIATLYRQNSSLSEFHFRIHSHKILNSIEEQLSLINDETSLKENQKKRIIKKLFNSFFELAKVYDLTQDMKAKMFYCHLDKSLWFQTDKTAQNPINPDYKNCATQVL